VRSAAPPYGVVGALICLAIMGSPFGFTAFLGIASLIGVIVSHVIVLFDFIEEMHEKGEPFEQTILQSSGDLSGNLQMLSVFPVVMGWTWLVAKYSMLLWALSRIPRALSGARIVGSR
jgi:Cu/Ag efflux pump CusA